MERIVKEFKAESCPGEIDLWDDTRLQGGDIWLEEINQAILEANVALLLLSNHFMNSSFIQDEELPRIFQSRIGLGTRLIPVLLNDVDSSPDWLRKLQWLPERSSALSSNQII